MVRGMRPLLNKNASPFALVILFFLILHGVKAAQNDDFQSDIHNLINQADSLLSRITIDSCLVVYKVVLEKMKKEYSESDSLYLYVIKQIGQCYNGKCNFVEAIRYYNQWLSIVEKSHILNPSEKKYVLVRLGTAYRILSQESEAEICLRQAIQIQEKTPEDSTNMLNCLQELGTLYWSQARYPEAETCLKRAMEILKVTGREETERTAAVINRLATICSEQGKDDDAISLHLQAIEIRRKVYGSAYPPLSESMNNLGIIYRHKGRLKEAEELFMQALKIRENATSYGYGPEHPYLWYPLINLGDLRVSLGQYDTAEAFYNRSLKIIQKAYGLSHPHAGFSLIKLAMLHAATKEYDKSLADYNKLMETRHKFIEDVFSYASEEQKMRYISQNPLIEHSFLSLAILDTCTETKRCALEMILKGKAVVLDALSAEKEIAFCVHDEKIILIEKQLDAVSNKIASISLAGINNPLSKEDRDSLQSLYRVKDSLETQFSHSCSEFKDDLSIKRFTITNVTNAIPDGSILWEFVRYEPYDFKKVGNDEEQTLQPRYLAFTLDHAGKVTLTNLGDAGEIDSLVSLARKQIYKAREEVYSPLAVESERRLNEVTGKLYDLLFAPLESHLSNNTDIFISPDGQLNLLPFEILPCPDGKYVIEKFKISYLSSGRDLLKFKKKHEAGDWALVMADPDFDHSETKLAQIGVMTLNKPNLSPYIPEPLRGTGGCLNNRFNLLPYSREETKSVVSTLKKEASLKIQSYYGGDASEEVLKKITTAPKILHLATHGFFCEDLDLTENRTLENPLLRSGLALAGANRLMDENLKSDSLTENGILTAFEASGLNLIGTELVILSACETGLGEVKNGEGVYGLRRAFQHAGAQTIVMSLWKIPDEETCELMDAFYNNWLSGQSKKESLRQSALKVLNACRAKYGSTHPIFWGGFVMVGNPN
jgi:CHAT domain-containing protein